MLVWINTDILLLMLADLVALLKKTYKKASAFFSKCTTDLAI